MMRIHNARRATLALTATFLTVAGLAYAQQRTPYFRFGSNPTTTTPGSSLPSPWTPPVNDRPMEIGKPGVASYTVRALVGEPVNLTMATSGGSGALTWQAGTMPPGLGFANGTLSGTPSEAGKIVETVTVRDAQGKTAQGRVTIEVVEPLVVLSGLKPFARVGAALDGLVASNVATPTYVMRGLPGLRLGSPGADARATVSGAVTAPGTFPFAVEVSRPGTLITASVEREIVVESPLEIAFDPPSIPALLESVDVAVSSRNVAGTPTLTLTSPSASVLASRGLSFANGRLTGTLKYGVAANLSLKLKDSADGGETTATLRIPEVINGASSLVIASEMRRGTPPRAANGSTTAATVRTEIPSPRCTVTQAVPGLIVSTGCVISGAASTDGDHTLALTIVPSSNPGATPVPVSAPVKVHPALTLTSNSPSVIALAPGEPVDLSFTPAGVIGTARFDLQGATPAQLAQAGLAFNSATGAITGTPEAGAEIVVAVRVTDSHDQAVTSRTTTIRSAVGALASNIPSLNLRTGDVRTFTATTNIPSPTFSLAGAPDYVRIDPRLGVITITAPETAAPLTIPAFDLTVVSETREGVSKTVRVANPGVVRPELKLLLAESADGRGNVALEIPFSTEGVVGTQQIIEAAGSKPVGMNLLASAISGTPRTPGTYQLTLRLTDTADGRSIDHLIRIVVGPSLDIAFSGPVSPVGKGAVDQPFSVTASAQNSIGTVSFENVATASRPALLSQAGLTMTPQGVISGTPTAPLTASVNIRMTEVANGVTTVLDRDLSMMIAAAQTAGNSFPVANYNGTSVTPHLYDADASTAINLFGSTPLRLTFENPVTVNGIVLASTGSGAIYVKNLTTGQQFSATNPNGSSAFTQSTSDAWEITTNASYVTLQTMRLTYGGSAPLAPSMTYSASSSANFQLTGDSAAIGPGTPLNVTGVPVYSMTGDLPPGMTFSSSTGRITGTLNEVGKYSVTVTLTDERGASSVPRGFAFDVRDGYTANREFPRITSAQGHVPEETLAAMYDDVDTSFFALMDANTLTFTYSRPVTISMASISAELSGYTGSTGTFSITSVDEGKTFSASDWGDRSLTGQTPAVGTSRTWTVRGYAGGHSYIKVKQFALKTSGAHPVAPNIVSGGTINLTKGVYYASAAAVLRKGSLQGVPLDGTFQVIEGVLPNGLSLNEVTGVLSGTPTTLQQSTPFKVAFVTTIPGVRSNAQNFQISVMPAETATTEIPSISVSSPLTDPDRGNSAIASEDLLGYVYTASTTSSRFNLANAQSVTYTFDKDVKVSSLMVGANGSYKVINNDTGVQLFNSSATAGSYNSFTQSFGKSFTVVANAAGVQRHLRLGFGAAASVPHLGTYNTTQRIFAGVSQSIDLAPSATGLSYAHTGLPSGLSVDASGKIVGTTNQTGTFTATIRATDSRGYTSVPVPMTIVVFPSANAQNTIAVASAYGGKDSADVSAALMDASGGPTTVTLAVGGEITFSYPGPTVTNGLYVQIQSGATQNLEVRDGDGVLRYSAAPSGGYLNWNAAGGVLGPNGQYVSLSATLTVKNTGNAPVILARMQPHYGSSLAMATVYPSVTANASYSGIARIGAVTISPTAAQAQNGVTGWTRSGDELPTGFEFDSQTGAISRKANAPQAPGPETRTIIVTFTDGRGLSAMKWPITLQVN